MTADLLVLLCRLNAAIRARKWHAAYEAKAALDALEKAEVTR